MSEDKLRRIAAAIRELDHAVKDVAPFGLKALVFQTHFDPQAMYDLFHLQSSYEFIPLRDSSSDNPVPKICGIELRSEEE